MHIDCGTKDELTFMYYTQVTIGFTSLWYIRVSLFNHNQLHAYI